MSNLSEQDVRRIIRDEIRKTFNIEVDTQTDYLPTEQAYQKLGYPSRKELFKAIKNNTFRLGIEVQDRRSSGSKIARYYFNIPACINRLNIPPKKREKG